MTISEGYARGVESGEIVTGKLIKLAAKRFLSDLEREDLVFDTQEADRAVRFIETKLCQWEDKWAGQPLKLEPWQIFIIHQVFGWKVKASGKRRVRSVYIQIARKNGKTSFLAAIILYHLFADRVGTPQVLVGANDEEQAKICVNTAGRMIES
jgi:phage terminase large subunit-like protein